MKLFRWDRLKRLWALLEMPAPDPEHLSHRIRSVERDVVLPIKAVVIGILIYHFFFPRWVDVTDSILDVVVEDLQTFFLGYLALNVVWGAMLMAMDRLPLAVVQWGVFTSSLLDALFLASITLLTGGYDSVLYWVFIGLIIRNAVTVPPATVQLMLNLSTSLCYVLAGILEVAVSASVVEDLEIRAPTGRLLDLELENPAEPLLLRLILLWAVALCGYGVQVLLERQRLAMEEAREFAVREAQLRSAGRVAAEIAHQMKNPLGIINNAAFSLRRALATGKDNVEQQIQIIQEEVDRSDRIITQLMGYAQLTEGHVERLTVTEELERAIAQVFPPAATYEIQIHRDYAPHLPPLLMQRGHLSEILVNLLQNSREALQGRGNIFISAHARRDSAIEMRIRDDGPGIAPDKLERVFEAYFSTKEKGTGLGLSIVKHNVELYGGTVRVESELGKGAEFVLVFPAKTLLRQDHDV